MGFLYISHRKPGFDWGRSPNSGSSDPHSICMQFTVFYPLGLALFTCGGLAPHPPKRKLVLNLLTQATMYDFQNTN